MKKFNLAEIESHPDTEVMLKALTDGHERVDWVRLFSAYGKHAIGVRRDPSEIERKPVADK
jgi:hypothetical protein